MRLQHQQPGRETELVALSRATMVVKSSLNRNPRRAEAPGVPNVGRGGGCCDAAAFFSSLTPRAKMTRRPVPKSIASNSGET